MNSRIAASSPTILSGEIPSVDGLNIVIDGASNRVFYIPEVIEVYNWQGQKLRGSFVLNPETGVAIGEGASIDPTADIGNRAVIGAEVRVFKNAKIGSGTILEDKVYVKRGISIGPDTLVGRKSIVGCNVGRGVSIGSSNELPSNLTIYDLETIPPRTFNSELLTAR